MVSRDPDITRLVDRLSAGGLVDRVRARRTWRIVVPPGLGSPWHLHPEEDEWLYVLDGNLTFYVGDTRLDLTSGGFAFGPKGVPHTFIGAGPEPTRARVRNPESLQEKNT